jgi:hypothetical protein
MSLPLSLIRQKLSEAKTPIVCFSGGNDSLLLLHLVREVDESIPVLVFGDFFPPAHKKWVGKVITDLGLTAFFYKPSVLKYESGSIISHYPFFASSIPVISDVIPTSKCGLDQGRRVLNKAPLASFLWDTVFLGSRKTDSHKLVPELDFSSIPNVVCPLWDMTDGDVKTAMMAFNIEPCTTSSDAHYCMNCLEPEGRTVWCPKLSRNIESIGTL